MILPCPKCCRKVHRPIGHDPAGPCSSCIEKKDRKLCANCSERVASRPRCLCWKCSIVPSVRKKFTPADPHDLEWAHEPTEAELDALIEQQRPTMPEERGAYDTFGLLPASRYGRAACPVPTMGRRVMRKAWRH